MTELKDLMDMVEQGTVLVFPTEESARAFSSLYVSERNKGLLASSCIAFDSFASLFMPEEKGRRQAGDAERLAFSAYASSVLSEKLTYFASPDYPEIRERLSSFFRTILPSLDDALSLPKKSREASADLLLLRHEYGKYLENSGLYESAFTRFSMPSTLCGEYALVMPAAFPKEEKLLEAISGLKGIRIIDDLTDEIPALTVFGNEKSELRSLFIEIRKLTDSGVSMDEIAISVAPLDRLRSYIEDEAYLFGIPLDFREGTAVLTTSPGSFLSGLYDIYSSSYSLDALKSFMLNPAIPFRNPEAMRKFIASAVGFSITSAPDRRNDRYMKLSKDSGQEYYRVLRLTLDKLMMETNPDKIEGYLHTLMSSLLADEEFHGNEEDENIYSFSMRALSDFLATIKTRNESGFISKEPVFPLFITYLKNLRYVPRERVRGVAVYPFTQDAAVPYRYRFIIALNEREGTATVRKASFLSDYEIAGERDDADLTKLVLSLYSAMTENLYLSASYETYAGFSLPLTSMLASAKEGKVSDDIQKSEEDGRFLGYILPLQRIGYEKGLLSSLRLRKTEDDMTYGKKGRRKELPVKLSYSSYNLYVKCPYQYALQYVFGLRNLPSYEPVDMDHLEIGTRLHSILETYYRENHVPDDIPFLFDDEMALWTKGKRRDGSDMAASASKPTAFLISYLRTRYLPKLEAVVRRMDDTTMPLPGGKGLEEPLSSSYPELGFNLEGRVDRLALSKDGSSLVIFDYKKGRKFQSTLKEEKSYQFHIYKLLLSSSEEYSLPVSDAYFVSLLDGCFSQSSQSPDLEILKNGLKVAGEGIGEGDWHAKSGDDNCKGCIYKGICRRRFSVR